MYLTPLDLKNIVDNIPSDIFSPLGYKKYLKILSEFPQLSLTNHLLIFNQTDSVSQVLGYPASVSKSYEIANLLKNAIWLDASIEGDEKYILCFKQEENTANILSKNDILLKVLRTTGLLANPCKTHFANKFVIDFKKKILNYDEDLTDRETKRMLLDAYIQFLLNDKTDIDNYELIKDSLSYILGLNLGVPVFDITFPYISSVFLEKNNEIKREFLSILDSLASLMIFSLNSIECENNQIHQRVFFNMQEIYVLNHYLVPDKNVFFKTIKERFKNEDELIDNLVNKIVNFDEKLFLKLYEDKMSQKITVFPVYSIRIF